MAALIVGATLLRLGLSANAQQVRSSPYLEGVEGPYHGRVVDAETGRALAGAVVVAVWSRERSLPLVPLSTVFDAARETLTGPDGSFVLDGRDVEARAPLRTLPPDFIVYYPGYAAITSPLFVKSGGSWSGVFPERVTVRLPRLGNREDRRWGFPIVPDTPTPFKDLPNLMRLINVERTSLNLEPLPDK